ncbi:MAG: hypothetical protein V1804_04090 [Patescibacteria group bacterium]
MTEVLDFLFGSKIKARLLRFFLMNAEQEYNVAEISRKNMLKSFQIRATLNDFRKNKFILERKRGGKKFYIVNQKFPFFIELCSLFIKSNVYPKCGSLAKIKSIGDVKLALVSGIFLNYPKSKADLILVANNISRSKLNNLMSNLEAEVGREISFVLMNSDEFNYRLNMLDHFVLDFLEGPHDELVNKIPRLKVFISGLKR